MSNLTQTPVVINNQAVQVVAFKDVPVVTTAMLATFYGTDDVRIQQNHTRNADRFEEGKHFFKVEGEELRDFKLTSSEIVSKNTRSIILWTERGAARHAKLLETDQAWEVFEKLEDCYFAGSKVQNPTSRELSKIEVLQMAMESEQKAIALQAKVEVLEPKAAALEILSQNREGYLCLTDAAKHLHVKRNDLTNLLANHKMIYRRSTSSVIRKGKWAAYEVYIKKGWFFHDYAAGEKPDGTDYAPQLLVTPKGMTGIAQLVAQEMGEPA